MDEHHEKNRPVDPDSLVQRSIAKERIEFKKNKDKAHRSTFRQLLVVSLGIFLFFLTTNYIGTDKDYELNILFVFTTLAICYTAFFIRRIYAKVKEDDVKEAGKRWKAVPYLVGLVTGLVMLSWIWQVVRYSDGNFNENSAIWSYYFISLFFGLHLILGNVYVLWTRKKWQKYEVHSRAVGQIKMAAHLWIYLATVWTVNFLLFSI